MFVNDNLICEVVFSSEAIMPKPALKLFFLLWLGCKHYQHTFAFHLRHSFQYASLFEPVCKFQQQQLSSFLELYRTSFKLYICFYFIAVFQEFFCVLAFKIKVMDICT